MWQSITDADTRRRCWSAIEEIERALEERLSAEPCGAAAVEDPLLANGTSGLALFFAYLDAVRHGPDAGDRAVAALGRSIQALGKMRAMPALYSGFCGVGWVLEHLTRELFEGDDGLAAEIDQAVAGLLAHPGERPKYELVDGLSGLGVYLLERSPDPGARQLLGRVLDRLEAAAERSDGGLAWRFFPEWLPPWKREDMPEGGYNLGVAHGIPGVVGFLAAARRAGIEDPRLPRLAAGAIQWLLGHQLPDGEDSVFPAVVVRGQTPQPTRTAWCYGDLGIAAVLLSAARSFGRLDWEVKALSLARLAASRPPAATQGIDACLCHGACGIAHLFNRLYQATGEAAMKEAALAWYRRALAMHRPGEGIAGFWSYLGAGPGAGTWKGEAGFLVGIAGIGLALLAAVADVEPAWDRVMLVSIPPRPQVAGP